MQRPKPNKNLNLMIKNINYLSEIVINIELLKKDLSYNFLGTEGTITDLIEVLSDLKQELEVAIVPPKHDKAINIGMATIRNEEECIRGWAKTMLHFCDEVYALVDPATTDNTEQILKDEFKTIKILHQDRSLGDSDNIIEGENKSLIMHGNYNYFINELVDYNELFFLLSADERFFPSEFPLIEKEINFMRDHGAWNGWYIPQKRMWQFYPDDFHVIDFSKNFMSLMQFKIFRLTTEYKHGLRQHSGWNYKDFIPAIKSRANWFHYCFIKNSRPAFGYWRDIKDFKKYPRIQFNNPMPNWRTMPELNNKGDIG